MSARFGAKVAGPTEPALPRPLRTPTDPAPDPQLGTAPVPKSRYTSPEYARLEWERMWTRVWLMAGRASDIPEPGDYFTFEIGPGRKKLAASA